MPPQSDPLLVSVKAAAESLSLTPWSVYKLLDQADSPLKSVYQGRRRYVVVSTLQDYVDTLPDAADKAAS